MLTMAPTLAVDSSAMCRPQHRMRGSRVVVRIAVYLIPSEWHHPEAWSARCEPPDGVLQVTIMSTQSRLLAPKKRVVAKFSTYLVPV